MPIYEYECPDCGRFEVIQKFSDKELKECPNCKEKGKDRSVTKAVSAASFHLKGSGWYKTDYASSSSSAGSSSKSSAPAASTSTESSSSSEASSSSDDAKPAGKKCGTTCGCH